MKKAEMIAKIEKALARAEKSEKMFRNSEEFRNAYEFAWGQASAFRACLSALQNDPSYLDIWAKERS